MGGPKYVKVNGKWEMLSEEEVAEQKYIECMQSIERIVNGEEYADYATEEIEEEFVPRKKRAKKKISAGMKAFRNCSVATTAFLSTWTLLIATNVLPTMSEFYQLFEYWFKWAVIMALIALGIAHPVEPLVI